MESCFFFLIGLVLGSFFNVCIYRIPYKLSLVSPPSHCPKCGRKIRPYDLIPVFSYLFLKGKCRDCKTKIAPEYLIVELLTGLAYLIVFRRFAWSKDLVVYLFLTSLLIIVTFIDLHHRIIPNRLVLIGTIVGIPLMLWSGRPLIEIVLGGSSGFLIMFAIALISRGGMGGGDVKFAGMLGIYLGWQLTLILLFLSFFSGAFGGIILIMLKVKGRKDFIPFGPFIALGAFLTVLYGSNLLNWYLDFL